MNDITSTVFDVVRRRAMTRSFDPSQPVTEQQIALLTEAGRRVPSAGFTQGVSMLVLTDPADRADYWRLAADHDERVTTDGGDRWLAGMSAARVLILVWTSPAAYHRRYAEPDKGWSVEDDRWSAPYWWVDAGMCVQNVLLCATDLGLGAAFVGVPPRAQVAVATRFAVPAEQRSVGLLALGAPAGPRRRPTRPRRPAGEVVHRHRWSDPGEQIVDGASL